MESMVEKEKKSSGRCNLHRDCGDTKCMFFGGDEPCWTRISPFKLRKRPSLLFRDHAEHCLCLTIACWECDGFNG
jgi:hypothetical protein